MDASRSPDPPDAATREEARLAGVEAGASRGVQGADGGNRAHLAWIALRVVAALAIIAALALLWLLVIEPHEARIEEAIADAGAWGPAAYLLGFAVLGTVLVPKSVLSVAGGAIFGFWWGMLWGLVGALLAAVATFLLGRGLLGGRLREVLARRPRLAAVVSAVSRRGARLVILLRMTPINFAAMNWMLAASEVTPRAFLLGCLGFLPGTAWTVAIGAAARRAADLVGGGGDAAADELVDAGILQEVALLVGLLAVVVVAVVVTRLAMRAVREVEAT